MSDQPTEASDKQDAQQSPTSRFHQGLLFTSTGTIINVVFIFLETIVAVQWLTPEDYGLFVLLVALVNFLVMVSDFGIATGVVKLVASSDSERQGVLVNSVVAFRLVIIAAMTVIVLLIQPVFQWVETLAGLSDYIIFIPLMLLFTSFDELLFNMLQGFQIYRHVAIAQSIRGGLRLALTMVFLAVFDAGIMSLIYSWTLSFAVSAVYAFLVLPIKKQFSWQNPVLKEILRFSTPLTFSRFLWYAFSQIHILLLGILAGPASVALYSVATRIPTVLDRFSQAYISVFFPTMSALIGQNQREQAGYILERSLRLVSFSLGLLAISVVVFNQELIAFLFPDEYLTVGSALALLMVSFQMVFIINIQGYTLTAAGHPGRSLKESTVRTTLTILLDLALIPLLSFLGPVLAVLFSSYASNPLMVSLLRRSGIPLNVNSYAKQIALLLAGVLLFAVFQPDHFVYKLAIILAFILFSVLLSTISINDFSLILPARFMRQADALKAPLDQNVLRRLIARLKGRLP
jgi:O-antigen/teichoic acid export membrane protein